MDLTLDGVETGSKIGGIAIQGTLCYNLVQGGIGREIMNAVGFDAMTIDNHEFDGGEQWLAGYIHLLDFPVINADIDVLEDKKIRYDKVD